MSKPILTVVGVSSNLAKRISVKSKILRRAIDRNPKVKQYIELDEKYKETYDNFVKAYNKRTEGLDKDTLSTSKGRFTFGKETFEIGTAKKFIDKKANFRTIHRYMNKLFPEIRDNYELGHKNISVLRANIALALSSDTFKGTERKQLLGLYTLVQEIDKISKIDGTAQENKNTLIQRLRDIAETGPDVSVNWKKDVSVVKGIKGSLILELENKNLNQFKGRLSAWVGEVFSSVIKGQTETALKLFQDIDIANLQGSPTLVDDVESLVFSTIVSGIKTGKVTTSKKFRKPKPTSSSKRVKPSEKKTKAKKKKPLARPLPNKVPKNSTTPSLASILGILNSKLPQQVAENMGDPRLNYRTGRFAGSVRVTDVAQTAKGFPSIGYTYMKYPYQTFEPGFAQGDVNRDPRKIIDFSIREIAAGMAMGRFYTRRV